MRIAVLADLHSIAGARGRVASIGSVDAVWQLGDVVGYGPIPMPSVARLREAGRRGQGNHDAAAVGDLEIEDFNADARVAMEWTRASLGLEAQAYLADLPEILVPGGSTSRSRTEPRDPIWEYLFNTREARENLAAFHTTYCLVGHPTCPGSPPETPYGAVVRRPESRLELDGRRAFLNPGSVGQPRDGDPTASYMLLDTAAGRPYAARELRHRGHADGHARRRPPAAAGSPAQLRAVRIGAR